jgi:hypothetical protein
MRKSEYRPLGLLSVSRASWNIGVWRRLPQTSWASRQDFAIGPIPCKKCWGPVQCLHAGSVGEPSLAVRLSPQSGPIFFASLRLRDLRCGATDSNLQSNISFVPSCLLCHGLSSQSFETGSKVCRIEHSAIQPLPMKTGQGYSTFTLGGGPHLVTSLRCSIKTHKRSRPLLSSRPIRTLLPSRVSVFSYMKYGTLLLSKIER